MKLFEDQKDSIKLTSLVSNVVDQETQQKIDVVKGRLIRDYGYDEESATDVLNYVASIFRTWRRKRCELTPPLRLRSRPTRVREHAESQIRFLFFESEFPVWQNEMALRIDQDARRFRKIVRGKVRQNLRKYISHGEMIGRKGRDLVSIPVPQLDVPRFRYGQNQGGVGQGEGEEGQPIAPGGDEGDGKGAAGSDPGKHVLEVELTLDEMAEMLGDELELPRN